MSTYTVTIDIADFVPDGVVPRLAFVTFSRAVLDDATGELVTTAPVSYRITQPPVQVTLEAAVVYKVRPDGIPGLGTFFAATNTDCTLADLYETHQVDPGSLEPVLPGTTVAEQLVAMQAEIDELRALIGAGGGGTPTPAFTDNGDGTFTPNSFTVSDAGGGTWSSTGSVIDNGDGTFTLAA